MNNFLAAMLIGTFAIAGVSPVAAQMKPTTNNTGTVGAAPTRDAVGERDSYLQQVRDEMRSWDQKVHDFNAKVQTKASEAETKAAKHLDDAWSDTKRASSRLETAGEADWNKAKASFKTTSAKLAVAWQKADPTAK